MTALLTTVQVASMGARLLRRLNAYEQVVRFSIASTQLIAAQASGGATLFASTVFSAGCS